MVSEWSVFGDVFYFNDDLRDGVLIGEDKYFFLGLYGKILLFWWGMMVFNVVLVV